MKKMTTYLLVMFLSIGWILTAEAQPHRKAQHKHKKEYYKKQAKRNKAYAKYAKEERKAIKKYYEKREKAYRKYAKEQRKAYRDHDRWYYSPKFHNRNEYVYFPKYHTYYDPYRRGYVYRSKNKWIFSQQVPTFMAGLNLGNINIQFMGRLPI